MDGRTSLVKIVRQEVELMLTGVKACSTIDVKSPTLVGEKLHSMPVSLLVSLFITASCVY